MSSLMIDIITGFRDLLLRVSIFVKKSLAPGVKLKSLPGMAANKTKGGSVHKLY